MHHMNMRERFTIQTYVREDGTIGKEYTPDRDLFLGDGGYSDGPGNSFDIPLDKDNSKRWGVAKEAGRFYRDPFGKLVLRKPAHIEAA